MAIILECIDCLLNFSINTLILFKDDVSLGGAKILMPLIIPGDVVAQKQLNTFPV